METDLFSGIQHRCTVVAAPGRRFADGAVLRVVPDFSDDATMLRQILTNALVEVGQLEGLRTMARTITDGSELSKLAEVLADANPRADLPPGQRRTQVARRKQATRRRG